MALLSGSPALDAIPSGFPPIDQCGTSRPQGPLADIGAFEAPALAGATRSTLTITLLPSNSVAIRLVGAPGATYNIEASTNLVRWTQAFVASAGPDGSFEFIDTNTDPSQARYYRAHVP
jgi:hypothetical protein